VVNLEQLQRTFEKIRSWSNNLWCILINISFIINYILLNALLVPILGVMQMAMVLEDSIFENTLAERFNKVYPPLNLISCIFFFFLIFHKAILPKTIGTQNLERLVENEPLEFFIMFSSFSSIIGLISQSNYAAGNAYPSHITLTTKTTRC
jgi:KR domain